MRTKTMLLAFGVVVAALFIPSKKSSAQTACIKDCMICSGLRLNADGLVQTANGYSIADCNMLGCQECRITLASTSALESPVDVLNKLRLASAADLPGLVSKYRTRLLINEERGLLVVQGTQCDKTALSTMAFLPEAKLKQVASLRVQSLAAYLDQKQARMLASR